MFCDFVSIEGIPDSLLAACGFLPCDFFAQDGVRGFLTEDMLVPLIFDGLRDWFADHPGLAASL